MKRIMLFTSLCCLVVSCSHPAFCMRTLHSTPFDVAQSAMSIQTVSSKQPKAKRSWTFKKRNEAKFVAQESLLSDENTQESVELQYKPLMPFKPDDSAVAMHFVMQIQQQMLYEVTQIGFHQTEDIFSMSECEDQDGSCISVFHASRIALSNAMFNMEDITAKQMEKFLHATYNLIFNGNFFYDKNGNNIQLSDVVNEFMTKNVEIIDELKGKLIRSRFGAVPAITGAINLKTYLDSFVLVKDPEIKLDAEAREAAAWDCWRLTMEWITSSTKDSTKLDLTKLSALSQVMLKHHAPQSLMSVGIYPAEQLSALMVALPLEYIRTILYLLILNNALAYSRQLSEDAPAAKVEGLMVAFPNRAVLVDWNQFKVAFPMLTKDINSADMMHDGMRCISDLSDNYFRFCNKLK